ncbi:pyridoxamine 5'-phosphate oxidase family protein [Zhongshania sp.]|jgi:nitroimidazol reductase NimA-like FMN-containing flavoprotein (pyridoxamine 5'-phosphate oxidase superfamily)|uniref:pyridoxamine 5'-phosphate oxidase family protein n=1 Tax=Zhongshania sp. TaxID=1971902 RepID=UPI0039E5448D
MDALTFLNTQSSPIRLAVIDDDGFPIVCSLWFILNDDHILCATHASAKIIRVLKKNPHCAFEVSINEMPYKGVRGKALASLEKDSGGHVLEQLLERYVGSSQPSLTKWLLSRSQDEYAIRLDIKTMSTWDFSERMQGK